MSQESSEQPPQATDKPASPVEETFKLLVPAPELLEEETTPNPDVEPRVTGS
ncbi:hypothetical protein ACX80D_04725 [Arthrobacter sp. Sr24]